MNKKSVPSFLLKTYEMIEVNFNKKTQHFYFFTLKISKSEENQELICWNNEGKSFVIKNINDFSDKVLANFFKHSNFSSFVR